MKKILRCLLVLAVSSLSWQPTWADIRSHKGEDLSWRWSAGRCSGLGPVEFGSSPMKLRDLACIVPMGKIHEAHVTPIDHQYYVPAQWDSAPDQYDVRAPAGGFVVTVSRRTQYVGEPRPNMPPPEPQFRIVIEHSCTFYTYYDLVTRLSPKISRALGVIAGQHEMQVRVPVKEGEIIGKVGGHTLDFAAVNLEVTLPGFTVPSHYEREPWKIHTVDPFDYFKEPVRSQLLAINLRRTKPRGGKIDYDVDGRLVGNWFKEGTNGYAGIDPKRSWDGHLAMVYDALDPKHIQISLGNFGGRARRFGVRGNQPDPREVGVNTGMVKYELVPFEYYAGDSNRRWDGRSFMEDIRPRNDDGHPEGTILLLLLGERRLKLEIFQGRRASEVSGFTDQARIYER